MLTWLLITACRDVSPDIEDPNGDTTTAADAICEIDDDCPNGPICVHMDPKTILKVSLAITGIQSGSLALT